LSLPKRNRGQLPHDDIWHPSFLSLAAWQANSPFVPSLQDLPVHSFVPGHPPFICTVPLKASDFKMINTCLFFIAALAAVALGHVEHEQKPIAGPHKSLWYNTLEKLPGDGGTQVCRHTPGGRGLPGTDEPRPILFFLASQPSAVYPITHVWPVTVRNTTSLS